jgi:hypothetical protein
MARGRPISGVNLVDRLKTPREQRRRARIILATLTGGLTTSQACAQLGLGRSRVHVLRRRMLAGMFDALTPRPRGRPLQDPEAAQVRTLQARIRDLEDAICTTALRSRIVLGMPIAFDRAQPRKAARRQ